MGFGYLTFQTLTAENGVAVAGAKIKIYHPDGKLIFETTTDLDGNTEDYKLYAPNEENSLDPYLDKPVSSFYNATIEAKGYLKYYINQIPIFDTETTILSENLLPKISGEEDEITIDIPISTLDLADDLNENLSENLSENLIENYSDFDADSYSDIDDNMLDNTLDNMLDTKSQANYVTDNKFRIPEYITVHLGAPTNSSAKNVKVKFSDYIANVASGEIYPTWPQSSLEANIHAIITFALNRIYTGWYRIRGYNFDITGSPAYDMIYKHNGPVFENINIIVSSIFNVYTRRKGFEEPFFTQFCDGLTVQCNGMSQWGTVELAKKGYTPVEILRYYYRPDMQLILTNNIGTIPDAFPGTLKKGSSGNGVKLMQSKLNRIRVNFPLIPRIEKTDGLFGIETENAVKVFQKSFNMVSDGVIGRATWNKISLVFVAVTKISELDSEGIRVDIGETPPTVVLKKGSKGVYVLELQFLLNYISIYYTTVPSVIQDSVFDVKTEQSVIEFQKTFNLIPPDGIVGPATWNKLYTVYKDIRDDVDVPIIIAPPFPGINLKIGSKGSDVLLMQSYLNNINSVYKLSPLIVADGNFGQKTKDAVVSFQVAANLSADGIIGKGTWDRIVSYNLVVTGETSVPLKYMGKALRVGSVGIDVRFMQTCLTELSKKYPSLPVLNPDGKFGKATELSVRAFQNLFNLTSDGIIGEKTWYKIIEEYNK